MDLVFLALFILIVITFFALLKRSSDKPTESNYEKKADGFGYCDYYYNR